MAWMAAGAASAQLRSGFVFIRRLFIGVVLSYALISLTLGGGPAARDLLGELVDHRSTVAPVDHAPQPESRAGEVDVGDLDLGDNLGGIRSGAEQPAPLPLDACVLLGLARRRGGVDRPTVGSSSATWPIAGLAIRHAKLEFISRGAPESESVGRRCLGIVEELVGIRVIAALISADAGR